jgi:hypothetical protein
MTLAGQEEGEKCPGYIWPEINKRKPILIFTPSTLDQTVTKNRGIFINLCHYFSSE